MARTGKLGILILGLATACLAVDFRASARLGAQRVQVGEIFPLIVQAETDGDAKDLPEPTLTLAEGIVKGAVRKNQGSSTSIQIINGAFSKKVSTSVTWQIELRAAKPGKWMVGPVSLGGKALGQGEVLVEAGSGKADPVTGKSVSSDVVASTLLARKNVFVGEQIPFTWRLDGTKPFQVGKFPDIRTILGTGFWTVTPDTIPRQQVVTVGNVRKLRLDIVGSLFALRPGAAKVAGTSLDYQIVEQVVVDPMEAFLRGEDPFEAMMRGGRTRVLQGTARTPELGLSVLPVPDKERPPEFQGGVGKFTLKARLEKDSVRAGDGVNLVLSLEGDGQPQGCGVPVWTAPAGIEAYPPEDKWAQSWRAGKVWSSLERRIVLVPSQAGTIKLPAVRYAYFDPVNRKFQMLTVELPSLRVLPPVASKERNQDKLRAQDAPVLSKADRIWIAVGKVSAALWALLLTGLLAYGVWRWVRRLISAKARRERALRRLRQEASRVPALSDSRKQAMALRRILTELLVLDHGEASRGWTLQETIHALVATGWDEERALRLESLWKALDAAEFAGVPLDSAKSIGEFLQ
jgi:hypothetical protein